MRQGRCHHAPELSAGAHRHGCARGVPIARVSTTCGAATRDTSHAERTRYARDTDTAARGVCRSRPRHGAICRWRAVHCRTHMNCRLTGTNHPQTYAFRARTHTHTHRQKRKHARTQARALQASTDKHTQSNSPHATPGTDTPRPIAAHSTTPRLEQTKHHMPAPRVSDTSGRTHARADKGVPRMRTHSHTRQLQHAAATRHDSTTRARARAQCTAS